MQWITLSFVIKRFFFVNIDPFPNAFLLIVSFLTLILLFQFSTTKTDNRSRKKSFPFWNIDQDISITIIDFLFNFSCQSSFTLPFYTLKWIIEQISRELCIFLTRHLLRDEDTGFIVWNVVNVTFCFIRKERAEKDKNRGIKILFYFVYSVYKIFCKR